MAAFTGKAQQLEAELSIELKEIWEELYASIPALEELADRPDGPVWIETATAGQLALGKSKKIHWSKEDSDKAQKDHNEAVKLITALGFFITKLEENNLIVDWPDFQNAMENSMGPGDSDHS